jgi:hypothetical protein
MSGSPRENLAQSRAIDCIRPQRAHDRRCGLRIRDRHETFRKWVGLRHRRIHHTDQPAGAGAPSEVERGEEPERVVGESDLFEAEGSPELQHLVEGNAEDEFDVGLCGLIEQRRQNQSNASGP